MSETPIRVYDVFDTLATDNTYDLLAQDNPELCRQARENYTAVREQVIPHEERYRKQGLVKTKLLPSVRFALESAKSKGFALGVFSSGTPDGIKRMLSEGGIDDLIDEQISVDAIGKKDDSGTYRNLQLVLHCKGLTLASYADDKVVFCKAAADAFWTPGEELTTPRVYHVNSKKDPAPENCIRVASIADIG